MLIVLLVLAAGAWLFSAPLLRGVGSLFIKDGPPQQADAIVVLAGDRKGNRILKGADLARAGFAPIVIADDGSDDYGTTESELAINFAVQHGYSPNLFLKTQWNVYSTIAEAHKVIPLLRSRGVRKAIVVTTNWHTGRAGRIFRRNAPEITFYMVGADDPDWHNGNWWIDREGRKTFFMEGVKTVADFLGI